MLGWLSWSVTLPVLLCLIFLEWASEVWVVVVIGCFTAAFSLLKFVYVLYEGMIFL